MNDYVKKIRVYDENDQPQDIQIDYNALANLPSSLPANGGTADEATKALQDGKGNNIVDTYVAKTELKDYSADIYCKSIEAADNIYTNKNWTLKNGDNTVTYASGPIVVPYYIGTISATWFWDDWATGNKLYINLEDDDNNIVVQGYLTEIFDPTMYDILISFDDTTLETHYSAIAEAGLYLKSDGTLGITNSDIVSEGGLLHNIPLGVNISIYYVGGGVL